MVLLNIQCNVISRIEMSGIVLIQETPICPKKKFLLFTKHLEYVNLYNDKNKNSEKILQKS